MTLPRLHVVTNGDVLSASGFRGRAEALLEAHGPALALHLRDPGGPMRRLLGEAVALSAVAGRTGSTLLVNDRLDVALAAGAAGVQLGRRSIPVQSARALLGAGSVIGYSAHSAAEAISAAETGADFVAIGTIWASESHPDRPGAGLERVRETASGCAAPVLAIGGVTPERARESREAGAWGVALIRGVWHAEDAAAAAAEYLAAMGAEA